MVKVTYLQSHQNKICKIVIARVSLWYHYPVNSTSHLRPYSCSHSVLSLLRLFPPTPLACSSNTSLPTYLPLSQIDYDTAISAETELCFTESGAPVPCLQCVLIDWIAPARPSACIWPLRRFPPAKQQMPN